MPHGDGTADVYGQHDPMVADIVKTVFLTLAVTYLTQKRMPEMYSIAISVVAVILYWSLIQGFWPGGWKREGVVRP